MARGHHSFLIIRPWVQCQTCRRNGSHRWLGALGCVAGESNDEESSVICSARSDITFGITLLLPWVQWPIVVHKYAEGWA